MSVFKRVIIAIAIVAVLGGGSLGIGLSIGFAIGRSHVATTGVQRTQAGESVLLEEPVAFAFADQEQYIETLPIEVRVSNITEVVQTVSGSVVSINIEVPATNRFFQQIYTPGSGSGIFFAEDDDFIYIATNNHVIENAARITISSDDEYEVEATFIGGDWHADLAVLSVPRSALEGKEYHIAVFGDSSQMRVGDEVVAIGNPMGEGQTATRGIISAINRQISVDRRELTVLQTDAAINPGNSGGALANIRGEVIGINTAKAMAFNIEGMGYALPSNEALVILNQLLEDGTTPRPYLGIRWQLIDERTRDMFALPSMGAIVLAVEAGSAADEAGLMEGDLIVAYNAVRIETMDDFIDAITQSNVGDTVRLSIYRNGAHPMEVTAVLGDANAR
ncbi:MAG: trypsin-like peptidase domain-containing protein [Defluviitaleaceae bacterium]|nr:trypsin-like peptidase domain-containing protein [Defluviitaleaceae bacterium]